jgi:hypothetical protein
MTWPPGSRNGRGSSGHCSRSAASTSGPEAKDSTVAEVMKPTSCCQLGKGRKTIRPTTKVTSRLTIGTPRFVVFASEAGALPLRAIA